MPTNCTQTTTYGADGKGSRAGSSKTVPPETSGDDNVAESNTESTQDNQTEHSKAVMLSETSVVFGVPVDDTDEGIGTARSNELAQLPGYLADIRKNNMSSVDERYPYVLRRDSSFILPQLSSENKTSKRPFRSPFIQRYKDNISTNGFELRNLFSLQRYHTSLDRSMIKSSPRKQYYREPLPDFNSHPLVSARGNIRNPQFNQFSSSSDPSLSATERGHTSSGLRGITLPNALGSDKITRGSNAETSITSNVTAPGVQLNGERSRNHSEPCKGIGSSFLQSIVRDKHDTERPVTRGNSRIQKLGHVVPRNQMQTLIYNMD